MTETARTPQTFEEWRSLIPADTQGLWDSASWSLARQAWDAALASTARVALELSAAREVVDGARELRDIARAKLKAGPFAPNPEMTDALLMLDESLDAYDRLTTSEDMG